MATDAGTGREAELRLLDSDFAASANGARAVLITGEPGLGKSWVLDQACARFASEGTRVLRGHALDLPGVAPMYPLALALREVLASEAEAGSAERLLLAEVGIGARGARLTVDASSAPDSKRLAVFDVLASLCERMCADGRVVLALDDMHWSSQFTWEALAYVLRSLPSAPLFVLLAAREELLQRPPPESARVVEELLRLRSLRHLPLAPLDRAALTRLATESLGGTIAPEVIELLAARSEGNAFFAEELLADWRARGQLALEEGAWTFRFTAASVPASAPATLRLTIGTRLDRLGPDVAAVLAGAAILGRQFASPLLAEVVDQPPGTVAAALLRATEAGVVDEVPGGWRFRHDTIRETVLARSAASLPTLHQRAAEALTRSAGYAPGYESLASRAHHWQAAGDLPQAAACALAASRLAGAAHATTEALALASQGRAAIEQSSGSDARALAEARLAHGEAALAAGAFADALEPLTAACGAAAQGELPAFEGRAWLRLGTVHRRQERTAEAAGSFAKALVLLDRAGDGGLLAETLIALCDLEGLTRARYIAARTAGERAHALAAELGDRGLAARALLALANVELRASGPEVARPLLESAYEEAMAAGDRALAAEVCAALANAAYWTGRLRESWQYASRRLELAEQGGDVFALRHAHSWLAFLAVTRGDWDQGRDLIARSHRALARVESPEPRAFLQVVEGLLELRTGSVEAAIAALEGALAAFATVDPGTAVWYRGLLAVALVEAERTAEAAVAALALAADLEGLEESALPTRSARCALGVALAALGDAEAAARCEAGLASYEGDFHWWPARRALAALCAMRGDRAAAAAHLERAVTRMREEGVQPEVGLGLLAWAELGEPGAPRLASDALEVFTSLGMSREAARARALIDRPTSARGPRLSARELEVLRLLAQGLRNREIAAALVISERTAVNHVSHIFDKLGVESRAAAAAYAHQHGIL